MMRFDRAEEFRRNRSHLPETSPGDNFGWFEAIGPRRAMLYIMVAPSEEEWQHVSVSKQNGIPSWAEMCFVKELFWDDEDCVVQYHPPKSKYVNNAKNCLHLWCRRSGFPQPPTILVGIK